MCNFRGGILKSVAFMKIAGEGSVEKALELSGTDVGGWNVIVKPAPWQKVFIDPYHEGPKVHRLRVTGYDTLLPKIDIEMALCKHFSSCGEVTRIMVLSNGYAHIYITGEGCVEKALNLSGCNVGGMTLVVTPLLKLQENVKIGRRRGPNSHITGYMPPDLELVMANKKKNIEMEMEK